MLYLISYAIHMLVSVLFFLLIPFPWLIKGALLEERRKFNLLLKIYKRIIAFAHLGVIISFVTGFIMSSNWLESWFLLIIVIWVLISMYLGMTAKFVRIILEEKQEVEPNVENVEKLRKFSLFLMLSIIIMFLVKLFPYFN